MPSRSSARQIGIIMAGGSGERFWPLSRRLRPKQLLRLTQPGMTMLEEAVNRLAPLIPPASIYVVTGAHLAPAIRDVGIGIPDENILAEPCKRNTSGALAYAAAYAMQRYGGDGSDLVMAVTTADHVIDPPERFREVVAAVMAAAVEQDALATIGIVPTRPDTGYGYIQVDPDTPLLRVAGSDVPVFPVKAFLEKPDLETAQKFFADGNYYWNSGMFFWNIATFLRELETARPALASAVREMTEAWRQGSEARVVEIFEQLDNISIDYALMERARNVIVAGADFTWDDVGAWTALERTRSKDEDGNVAVGEPVLVDTRDCIVYNDAGPQRMAVGVIGAEGLVIVVAGDAVLVVPKDRVQDVRAVVQELQARNAPQV